MSSTRAPVPFVEMTPKHRKTASAEHSVECIPTPSPMQGGGASATEAASSSSGCSSISFEQAFSHEEDIIPPVQEHSAMEPPTSWLEKASDRVNTLINPDDILGALSAHYGMPQDHPIREIMRHFLNDAFIALDDENDNTPPYMVFQIGNLTQRRFPMEADAEMNLVNLFQILRKKRSELDTLLHKYMSAHYKMRNTTTLKGQLLALTAQVRHTVAPPPTKLEFQRIITDHINSMIVDAAVFTQYMQDFKPFMAKDESA